MNKIEVRVLNPWAIADSERMMVCAARLTQRGHKINSIADFEKLINTEYKEETVKTMVKLPHPTIQKFGVITVVVVGASRRFLAQITRHQNEVKFMSASLQYSNFEDKTSDEDFVVPYEMLDHTANRRLFLNTCQAAMTEYKKAVDSGVDNDSAGYMAPQALRNVLIISATPFQWRYMIALRSCCRNTTETRYIMLRIWEHLQAAADSVNCPSMFSNMGPACMTTGSCPEGKMSCGKNLSKVVWPKAPTLPTSILVADYPLCNTGSPYGPYENFERLCALLDDDECGGPSDEDKAD